MRTLIFAALLLAGTACNTDLSNFIDSHRASKSIHVLINLEGIHTLRLRGVNGSIHVTTAPQSVCDGPIRWSVSAKSTEALSVKAKKLRLLKQRKDGVLTLSVEGEPDSVSFDLKVPVGLNLNLDTSNDEIGLVGEFADVIADTSNDFIQFAGSCRSFQFDTSNDNIIIELTEGLGADSRADTSNGDIEVTCETALNAKVEADTSNGRSQVRTIQSDSPHELTLDTSNGDVEVRDGLERN